jgi:hypothetical protein
MTCRRQAKIAQRGLVSSAQVFSEEADDAVHDRFAPASGLGIYRWQVSRNSSWRGALTAVSRNDIGSFARDCGRCIPADVALVTPVQRLAA